MKTRMILASASPRRKEIFLKRGLEPEIRPAKGEETCPEGLGPEETVMFLALQKALQVEREILAERKAASAAEKAEAGSSADAEEAVFIIGADTVVVKEEILGKPRDREDAFRMLELLRGKAHQVLTGVAILELGGSRRRCFYERSSVFFADYPAEAVEAYVDSGEPMDKAGAYAIQGGWGIHVDHIEGDLENIIGFPMDRFLREYSDLQGK